MQVYALCPRQTCPWKKGVAAATATLGIKRARKNLRPRSVKHFIPHRPHKAVLPPEIDAKVVTELLKRDGIVVVKGLITKKICGECRSKMNAFLLGYGVDMDNPRTWHLFTYKNIKMSEHFRGTMTAGDENHN